MPFPEENRPINLSRYDAGTNPEGELVDLKDYRLADRLNGGKPDPIIVHVAYARDNEVYDHGSIQIVESRDEYERYKTDRPSELVNQFGQVYARGTPLLLHKKLADVIVDTAIDMRDRYQQFTVVMDGLRTYESNDKMQESRPDLVESGLLAKAGTSAHNRMLAVDSKLFELSDTSILDAEGKLQPSAIVKGVKDGTIPLSLLKEADEHGHFDATDMTLNSRFYNGPMSDAARTNRMNRLQAWQRASVKNKVPVANLLSEFWDDRVTGSPADLWRVISCRAMCIGKDGNPKTNPVIGGLKEALEALHEQQKSGKSTRSEFAEKAHGMFSIIWGQVFDGDGQVKLKNMLGSGAGVPPALTDFVFHEWLQTIHDKDIEKAGHKAQANPATRTPPAAAIRG